MNTNEIRFVDRQENDGRTRQRLSINSLYKLIQNKKVEPGTAIAELHNAGLASDRDIKLFNMLERLKHDRNK